MEVYFYKARKIGTKKVVKSTGTFESVNHANEYLINNKMVPLLVKKRLGKLVKKFKKEIAYLMQWPSIRNSHHY